ncbi:MAG: pyridoxamine 5'-phosphate oxidase family protein [Nocardioidaceae bacterium]
MTDSPRRLRALTRDEALRRLASVSVGRLVFTIAGLPAIRPVNHLVDDGAVIVRSDLGSGVSLAEGTVVAYEADRLDSDTHTGWSVIVTGSAALVEEPAQIERYEKLIHPWVAKAMTHVIRIEAAIVTGFELAGEHTLG